MGRFNPSDYGLPDDFEFWDEKSQRALLEQLDSQFEPKIWYCKRGRTCDGKPHEGVNYGHARADQWPPADKEWLVWLLMSGRGAGKTRSGCEWVRAMTNKTEYIALVGRTAPDVRDTIVEGESGILKVCERAGVGVEFFPSKRRLVFENGARAFIYSAEEPDRLRGPQHGAALLDEPAHMPLIDTVWYNLLFGLRLGQRPRIACTTTPLPIKWLKELIKKDTTRISRVSTYANLDNLAETFKEVILDTYEGTRLGRQELHGEILEDVDGALWDSAMIEAARVLEAPRMDRIIVAVDPAGTSTKKSDETGIVVLGVADDNVYILEDQSGVYTPAAWARRVSSMYEKWGANYVVAEKNYGGDMVKSTLNNADESMPVRLVTSRQGKFVRAEPVVAKYEQNKVHHVGYFPELEAQMTGWTQKSPDSPDRLDALVHGVTDLAKIKSVAKVQRPKGPKSALVRGPRLPRTKVPNYAKTRF